MLDFPHRTVTLPQGNLSTVVILSLPSLLLFVSPMGNPVGESLEFFFLWEVSFKKSFFLAFCAYIFSWAVGARAIASINRIRAVRCNAIAVRREDGGLHE